MLKTFLSESFCSQFGCPIPPVLEVIFVRLYLSPLVVLSSLMTLFCMQTSFNACWACRGFILRIGQSHIISETPSFSSRKQCTKFHLSSETDGLSLPLQLSSCSMIPLKTIGQKFRHMCKPLDLPILFPIDLKALQISF